ncbi:MAG TPA: hypothetical protein VGQ57_12470, partial [Polyangiaceae bacterium]|nr:hypothetical protein [Polyangiaceae bacterium]
FENPLLGAPFRQTMYDHPVGAFAHFACLRLLSWVFRDAALTVNVFYLLGFSLVTATSLSVARRFGLGRATALVVALLYAFAPYHLLRGETHLFLSTYYVVPVAILAVYRLATGDVDFRWPLERRTLCVLAALVLVASANVYYAFFTGVLLLVHGAARALRAHRVRPFVTAVALGAVLAGSFALNIAPNLVHFASHGRNRGGADRTPIEAEVHGLRPGSLVMPLPDHRVPALREARQKYDRGRAPLENASATLGAAGTLGLFLLLAELFRRRDERLARFLAESNLVLLLLGATGGAGSLIALFVTPLLRAYSRVSIFIAFLALLALGRALEAATRWLAVKLAPRFEKIALQRVEGLLATLTLTLGLLDQTSPALVPNHAALARSYRDDERLLRTVEASLSPGSSLFTLPYLAFPEGSEAIASNDLLRGYLHSRTLRFSAGAMNGTYAARWQKDVAEQSPEELVRLLRRAGFAGLYVDRRGMGDPVLENALAPLLGAPWTNAQRDLAVYPLARDDRGAPAAASAPDAHALERVVPLQWSNFYDEEHNRAHRWRWSAGAAGITLQNVAKGPQRVRIRFDLYAAAAHPLALRMGGLLRGDRTLTTESQHVDATVVVPAGTDTLWFSPSRETAVQGNRILSFAVRDLKLATLD